MSVDPLTVLGVVLGASVGLWMATGFRPLPALVRKVRARRRDVTG